MKFTFLFLILIISICQFEAKASGRIKVYFNNPVDTTVATGEHAVYLDNTIDDTLIAYINRAKFTIDVAVYNFNQTSGISSVVNAINQKFLDGVRVRWIYDGSQTNAGIPQLNDSIPKVASPTTSNYGIMHNKFMIVDANSSNDSDAIVWTGSMNWNSGQMNSDINNVVVIQDKNLALAYTTEFNEMWGDTGATPNATAARFGPYKTDNTPHTFIIDGSLVECYFSPSDNTNDRIVDALSSANSQIYFGVYTFTMRENADTIRDKFQNQGVRVAGIMDEFSDSYTPYSILAPVMGNQLKVFYSGGMIYHSKQVIIDPCDFTSDPLVETGSHNWTISANEENDENSLIIHDSTIANMYYQAFKKDFEDIGGILTSCIVGIEELSADDIIIKTMDDKIIVEGLDFHFSNASITDLTGKTISMENASGNEKVEFNFQISSGIYMLALNGIKYSLHKKFLVVN